MHIFWLTLLAVGTFLLGGCGGETLRGNGLPVHCLEEPEPGPCEAHLLRYFYDYRYDRCRSFHYGGCQGRVPFETKEACEETCIASGG